MLTMMILANFRRYWKK